VVAPFIALLSHEVCVSLEVQVLIPLVAVTQQAPGVQSEVVHVVFAVHTKPDPKAEQAACVTLFCMVQVSLLIQQPKIGAQLP
jgi:hypothetical protein